MPNNIAYIKNYTTILDAVYKKAACSTVLNSGRRMVSLLIRHRTRRGRRASPNASWSCPRRRRLLRWVARCCWMPRLRACAWQRARAGLLELCDVALVVVEHGAGRLDVATPASCSAKSTRSSSDAFLNSAISPESFCARSALLAASAICRLPHRPCPACLSSQGGQRRTMPAPLPVRALSSDVTK